LPQKNLLSLLSENISYIYQNSPFYRKWLQAQNIVPADIVSTNDLKKLTTVSKKEFAENNFDFLCCPKEKIADYCTTSGTTGHPVVVALTLQDIKRLAENEARTFMLAKLSPKDVCMLMLTLDRQFMAGIAYYEGLKKLGIPCIRSGSVSPKTQLNNIIRFCPTALVAVPSFILKIIETAQTEKIELSTLSVKKIICIGEPIRNEFLLPNQLAQRITSAWNVQLFSTYASSEMQTAFSECEAGKGNHANENLMIAEILDEQGNEVPPGMVGELTVTTLGVEGMPLLRYRTGDLVFAIKERCSCGREEMRISPVLGRKNELIKFKGTTIFPASFHNLLQGMPAIQDYLIEAFNQEGRTDNIIIHIALQEWASISDLKQQVEENFKIHLRVLPQISICRPEELAHLRPAESRKNIRFIVR
jgi:phenylacetate-CoA ligase